MMVTSDLDYLPRLPEFDYLCPKTIKEACSLLDEHRNQAKVIAGGTDLLVSLKTKKLSPPYLVNIKGIPGLDCISYSEESGLKIGALATLQSIASSPVVKNKFQMLGIGCNKIGPPQVRNMGTIGGNICNGGPSQDSLPSLLVLEAKLKLVSLKGKRTVPIEEFFLGPFQTALREGELLTMIEIPPPPPRSNGCYQWLTKKTEVDETLVGVAVLMILDAMGSICQDLRIGLCSVAPTPIRARRAEEILRGRKIQDSTIKEVAMIAAEETNPRSRAAYRRRMTSVLVKRAVSEVWRKVRQTVDRG